MSDIVERLRQIPKFADFNAPPLIEHEAADEIERLREVLASYKCDCAPGYCEVGTQDDTICGARARAALEEGKE
jgi:hypothetical protein